jgi:hypothetical protein
MDIRNFALAALSPNDAARMNGAGYGITSNLEKCVTFETVRPGHVALSCTDRIVTSVTKKPATDIVR